MADVGKQLLYYNGPGPKVKYKDIGEGFYAQTVALSGTVSDPSPVYGPNTKVVRLNPVVSISPAYAINDVIGGKMVIENVARSAGAGGIINSIVMTSKVDIPVGVTIDILLFNTDPTNSTFTDNSAIAVDVLDLPFLLPGIASLSNRVSLGTTAALTAHNLGIPVDTLTTDDLWAVAVIRGAATLDLASVSDIQFVFGFLPD